MIETTGLRHVHLLVSDVERSARFYREAFGMVDSFRDGSTVYLSTPRQGDYLALEPAEATNIQIVGNHGGFVHFGLFRVDADDDFDAARRVIEDAGGSVLVARVLEENEHGAGLPYMLVADPDGYRIEL